MGMKDWLGRVGKSGDNELTVQDLLTLGRRDEAESRLRVAVDKNPRDLRSRRMLADLYVDMGRHREAVEEFAYVAASWTQDGFHDRALALLNRVRRLVPAEDGAISQRMDEIESSKVADRRRAQVREALASSAERRGTARGALAIEVDRCWEGLQHWSVVEDLGPEQYRRLFAGLRLVEFQAGDWIVRKGEELERLFVVLEGEVEACLPGTSSHTVVRSFTPGDTIGEAALLERRGWCADYRARSQVVALALDRQGLEKAVVGNPDPKALLDSLRRQASDRQVQGLVGNLGKS